MLSMVYKNNIKYNISFLLILFLFLILYFFIQSSNDILRFSLYLNWIFAIFLYLYAVLFTEKDPFSPIYLTLIAFFLKYYLSSYFLFNMQYEFIPKVTNNKIATIIALIATNIFLLFFLIGYKSNLINKFIYKLPNFSNQINLKKLKFFSKLTTLILFSLIIYIILKNGLLNFFYGMGISHGLGKFVYLLNFVVIAPYLLYYVGYKKSAYLVIFGLFIFDMLIQARGVAILTVFWFMVFLYYNGHKVLKYTLFIPILIIIAYVVGLTTGSRADKLFNDLSLFIDVLKHIDWNYLMVMSIGRLEELAMYIERVPLEHNYFYGESFFYVIYGPFLKFVPFFDDWRYTITNLAMNQNSHEIGYAMGGTGIAEWYVNFSIPGIIFGGFFYGMLYRIIYVWGVKSGNQIHLLFYILLLPIIFGMVGEAFGHIFSIIYKIIPLFIILTLSNLKIKRKIS